MSRFKSHNSLSKKGYTIRYRPWVVIYVEFFCSKKECYVISQPLNRIYVPVNCSNS
ncbi:MAG: GIY-YIG nuclease family protein [Flavobacteriaceae bacterium]|nr:GIY-YIG nuclease family protein [Flavobacteriaceae bacterium]